MHSKPELSVASLKDQAVLKVSTYLPQMLHKQKARPASKKLAANTQETVKPIHFDFYDELPKAQLDFSQEQPLEEDSMVEEPKTTTAALKKPSVVLEPKKKDDADLEQNIAQELATDLSSIQSADTTPYILQLSVFHNIEAANRYRLALNSAGLKVDIVKVKIGKEVVYRLQQGPYHNLDQLKLAKKRLTERGIACDVRKASPYVM